MKSVEMSTCHIFPSIPTTNCLRSRKSGPGYYRPRRWRTFTARFALVATIVLLGIFDGRAQNTSASWSNLAGGSWIDGANWSGGAYADGTDDSASFTNLALTGDVAIMLDGARTIGNLYFDDQSSTKHNWSLLTGAGDPLTLSVSAGSPTIYVGTNVTATLGVSVSGGNGFAKTGAGTLVVTGPVSVTGGNLIFSNGTYQLDGQLNSSYLLCSGGGGSTPNVSIGHDTNDQATLLITSGTYAFGGDDIMAIGNYGNGTYLQTGGTVTYGNSWGIGIGNQTSNAIGVMIISGGTFTDNNNAGEPIWVGMRGAATLTVSGTGVLNANTGITMTRGVGGSAGNATISLNGGELFTASINKGTGPGTAVINFNGGTLAPLASTTTFLTGLTAAYVQSGGAVVDTAGNDITLGQALLHDTNGLGSAADGGLVKLGDGMLTLAGTNTYTGNTVISNGTLELTQPMLTPGSSVAILSGAYIQLSFTGTNQVTALSLDGVSQPPGLYNSATTPSYLSGDGSLLVASPVAGNPTNLLASVSGGTISISWPADHMGWILQQQSNSLTFGISTNWTDVSGSDSVTSMNISINPALPTVFFRLRHP